MKPQQLDSIERAIVSVQDELYSLGLEHVLFLSTIEDMLMAGCSTEDIIDKAISGDLLLQ